MTDEEREYYLDLQHDYDNEIPDSIMYCVLALLGMFSYMCIYLVRL